MSRTDNWINIRVSWLIYFNSS